MGRVHCINAVEKFKKLRKSNSRISEDGKIFTLGYYAHKVNGVYVIKEKIDNILFSNIVSYPKVRKEATM